MSLTYSSARRYRDQLRSACWGLLGLCIVWGLIYLMMTSLDDNPEADSFAFNYQPEVTVTGPLVDKMKRETLDFVLLVDGTHQVIDNISVDSYYKNDIGETLTFVTTKESRNPGVMAFITFFAFVFATITAWHRALINGLCLGFIGMFGSAALVSILIMLPILLVLTMAAHYNMKAAYKILQSLDCLAESKQFMFCYETRGKFHFFKNVYAYSGQCFTSKQDMTAARLKGEI